MSTYITRGVTSEAHHSRQVHHPAQGHGEVSGRYIMPMVDDTQRVTGMVQSGL